MSPNFDDLTPDAIIKLASQFKAENKLSALQEEHELLRVKSEIEGIDRQADLNRLEIEISTLKGGSGDSSEQSNLLMENFRNQNVLKDRLEKLEQKRNTIQLEVYQALKDEYSTELSKLTQDLDRFLKKLEVSREQTQPLIQVLNFQIEELAVRKDVEELPADVYLSREKELTQDLESKTNFLLALDFILKQVKS